MATMVHSNTYQLPSSRQFKVFGRGASPPPPPSPSRRTRGSSNIQYGAPGVNCRRSLDMEHAVGILIDYDDDDEDCEPLEMCDEPEEIERGGISFAGFSFDVEDQQDEEEDDYMSTTQEGLFTFKEDATLVPSAPAPLLALLAEQAEVTPVLIPELSPLDTIPASAPEVAIVPATPLESEPPSVPTVEPVVAIRSPPKRQTTLQAMRDAPPPPARVPPPLPPRTPSPVPRILISPPDELEREQEQEREEAVLEVVEATKVSRTTASVVSVGALASIIVGPHMKAPHEKTPLIKRASPPPPPPSPGSWSSGWITSIAVVLVLTPTVLYTAHLLSK